MRIPIYEVYVGESLPELSLWVEVNGELLDDLAIDAAFVLEIFDPDDDTQALVTKTQGFVGQTGQGVEGPEGIPNLVVRWNATDELDQLVGNRSHKALLTITRPSDSKRAFYEFVVQATGRPGA